MPRPIHLTFKTTIFFFSLLAMAGCAKSEETETDAPEARSATAAIREFSCSSDSGAAAVELKFRIKPDGTVAKGVMFRGRAQENPDVPLDAISAVDRGDWVEVSARSGALAWRFEVGKSSFTDAFEGPTSSELIETNDPAVVTQAAGPIQRAFGCGLRQAQDRYFLHGDAAKRLYSLMVTDVRIDDVLHLGRKLVVVLRNVSTPRPNRYFRLMCTAEDVHRAEDVGRNHSCSVDIPALVERVDGDLVHYVYEPPPDIALELGRVLGNLPEQGGQHAFSAGPLTNSWDNRDAPGSELSLACGGGRCRVGLTAPDPLMMWVKD
jgi:hypothetical protein